MKEILNTTLFYDVLCVLLPLLAACIGKGRGAAKSLSGLVSAAAGTAAGLWAASSFSAPLAEQYIMPYVLKLLEKGLALPTVRGDMGVSAGEIIPSVEKALSGLKIPSFSWKGIVDGAVQKLTESGEAFLSAMSQSIAQRMAAALLFVLIFIAVNLLASVLFKKLVPMIAELPLIRRFDEGLGFTLGLLNGLILTAVIFICLHHFLPELYIGGGPLTPGAAEQSYVVKYYFHVLSPLLG